MRPDHRRGKSPWVFYGIGLALAAIAVVGVLVATGALRTLLGPVQNPGTKPVSRTPAAAGSRPSTSTGSKGTSGTAGATSTAGGAPLPSTAEAESASAVKEAALPYPNPPAVTPQTITHVPNPSRKLVAITLDDGIPFDTRILDLFEQKNIRCTTFLLGQFVKTHPELVKRLDRDGFEIANHTWDHKNLTKLSNEEIRSELRRTQDAISAITGNQAPYMRPPGGATNTRVRKVAGEMGFRVVLWNRSFADTSTKATPTKEFRNVMDGLQPGDIILCHWGGKDTYEAMKLILPEMERRGFTPVTISELLKYSSQVAGTTGQQGTGGAGTAAGVSAGGAPAAGAK
jgi:peptidoglycan/xylan/chitin deacetylase (PgdA/CDA1 family)